MRQIRNGWKEPSELPHSIKAESLPKARSTMRAITLKPTDDRLTDTVVLALMNWISKGDRATAPFLRKELSKSECVLGYYGENPLQETLRLADSRSVP